MARSYRKLSTEEQIVAHAKAGRRYWPPELRAELLKRFEAGETADALARQHGTTREAMAGVIHRERYGWAKTNGQTKPANLRAMEVEPPIARDKKVTLPKLSWQGASETEDA